MKTVSLIIPLTVLSTLYLAWHTLIVPLFNGVGIGLFLMKCFRDRQPTSQLSALSYDAQVTLRPEITYPNETTCLKPQTRKEWRALTHDEKKNWMRAVKCLASLPSSKSVNLGPYNTSSPVPYNTSATLYDDFTYVHEILRDYLHQTGFFFPWHRLYLWHFERTLKEQCNYTESTPYWDWTLDSDDLEHSPFLTDSDPEIGFGNFGDDDHEQIVIDGALAYFPLSYPYPHFLRRQYFPYPWSDLTPPLFPDPTIKATDVITIGEINKTVTGYHGDFRGFQTYFERMQGPHLSIHYGLGGDIGGYCIIGTPYCPGPALRDPGTSPNDPIFWLHHGMIDKIWYDWQHMHGENMYAFGGGSRRELETWPKYPVGAPPDLTPDSILPSVQFLPGNVTVKDMFDTTSGLLCYTYE